MLYSEISESLKKKLARKQHGEKQFHGRKTVRNHTKTYRNHTETIPKPVEFDQVSGKMLVNVGVWGLSSRPQRTPIERRDDFKIWVRYARTGCGFGRDKRRQSPKLLTKIDIRITVRKLAIEIENPCSFMRIRVKQEFKISVGHICVNRAMKWERSEKELSNRCIFVRRFRRL